MFIFKEWIYELSITEPTTMATDYALAVFTFVFAWLSFRHGRASAQKPAIFWAAFFFFMSVAGILGGTYHGFVSELGEAAGKAIWKGTVYSIGLGSMCMVIGTIIASALAPARNFLTGLAAANFLVYAFVMVSRDEYKYVIYETALCMVAVLGLQIYVRFKYGEKPARWIIFGVLLSFAAASIQQSGIDLDRNFNHNDIYHAIQMGAMYLLYRGCVKLRDRAGTTLSS